MDVSMRFERGPYGEIMVFPMAANTAVVLHALDVLQNSTIPSIFPVYYREQLGCMELCINCTGHIPIRDVNVQIGLNLEQKKSSVAAFLHGIHDAEDHFLNAGSLVMDANYVFFDVKSNNLKWCFLPIRERDETETEYSGCISPDKLEILLMDTFFCDALTEGDRNQIVCLLKDGRDQDFLQFLDSYANDLHTTFSSSPQAKRTGTYLRVQLAAMISTLVLCMYLSGHAPVFPETYVWTSWYAIVFIVFLVANVLLTTAGNACSTSLKKDGAPAATAFLTQKEILFPSGRIANMKCDPGETGSMFAPVFLTRMQDPTLKADRVATEMPKRAVIWVDDFLIGRDKALCDLFLDHSSISDRHARILHRSPLYYLMDLGSKSGTFIGHRRLYSFEETPLKDGDEIGCGNIKFLFNRNVSGANNKGKE